MGQTTSGNHLIMALVLRQKKEVSAVWEKGIFRVSDIRSKLKNSLVQKKEREAMDG